MKVWQADLCVFTAAMIGAITYPIAQYILQQMDLLLFHIIRFPLLSLLFLPLVLRQASVPWRSLCQAALPGVFLWLGIICWSFGVMLTDKIGSAAFIISLQSIFAPFLSRLVFGTRLQLGVFVSLFIATGGMARLNVHKAFEAEEATLGMMGSPVFNAFYLLSTSRFAGGFSPFTMHG